MRRCSRAAAIRNRNMVVNSLHSKKSLEPTASRELHALSREIVDLFYTQTLSPEEYDREEDVCRAFSDVLLRHWELCCIVSYLRDEATGRLKECASYTHHGLQKERALHASAQLARAVERKGHEIHLWLEEDETNAELTGAFQLSQQRSEELQAVFEEAEVRAGVAVPIYARGALVGALVVLSAYPERLRAALKGVRFVAPPIMIAVSNARRYRALRDQSRHIEQLVEELQQHGRALEEANAELQRVARYRSLFLQRMSHELRTPLTSMLGFAEILVEQEGLTDAQRRFCERIQSAGLQLQASLNQLVDLSRLEGGQSEIFLHEFSLREMLRELCGTVARLAQKQDVTVEYTVEPDAGAVVSDEGKLRQVLYNFLAYAISRSPAGGRVAVSAGRAAAEGFYLEVSDEGEPLADPTHLFQPQDDSNVTNERGTNMNELGLVIAYRLTGVLGGTVELGEARPLCGLRIRLNLPSSPVESPMERPAGIIQD
ncbi:MAG: HAMP domain-containing histidine kinase [Pyrinomonadaceae bacterium]|nr:HAMP domain-containing histidine kinase [Pyrinomonadaceae bacterium]